MTLARLLPAIAVLAFTPAALAQAEKPAVDLIASIFGGIGDGATAIVGEEMRFTRSAAGRFEGRTATGDVSTLTVDETTPCLFDLTYIFGHTVYSVRIDPGLIRSITFTAGDLTGDIGLARTYIVKLDGAQGLAMRLLPQGNAEPLGHSPPIATSIPHAELEAAAARLQELCPAR